MIKVLKGDITQQQVDCIVNAANTSLIAGGGVDNSVHQAAGVELANFLKNLGGCITGKAKLSPGFQLFAKHIIHAVGPIWQGGFAGEAHLLQSCYTESLQLAKENLFESIAFPCISTGAYCYPLEEAACNAIYAVEKTIREDEYWVNKDIRFVCFDSENQIIYESLLQFPQISFEIEVEGKVQGVYYRAKTKEMAEQFDIYGTVQNKNDGTVYIRAESDRISIQQLINWCRIGPQGAQVSNLRYKQVDWEDFEEFNILKD
jgi:O-acetyl-ADP-ribose deacetylase (regulator of RNase III)/acylphosphatase